jgi:hypothetical protein
MNGMTLAYGAGTPFILIGVGEGVKGRGLFFILTKVIRILVYYNQLFILRCILIKRNACVDDRNRKFCKIGESKTNVRGATYSQQWEESRTSCKNNRMGLNFLCHDALANKIGFIYK